MMTMKCSENKHKTNFSIHKLRVNANERIWRHSRMDGIIYLRRKHDNRFLRFPPTPLKVDLRAFNTKRLFFGFTTRWKVVDEQTRKKIDFDT